MIVVGLAEWLHHTHLCLRKMAVSRIAFLSIERRMLMATCTVATASPMASAATAAKSSHSVTEFVARSRRMKETIACHTDLNCRIGKQFKLRRRCMGKFSSLVAECFCHSHHCHKKAELDSCSHSCLHRSHLRKIELVDHILIAERTELNATVSAVHTLCCKN